MRALDAFLGLQAIALVRAADPPTPRGVGPEFIKFYKDRKNFACISNPSIILPASRINDDYCDCPDGSDEPGTAACAHLSPLSPRTPSDSSSGANVSSNPPTLALPGFFCKNTGHIATYLPFTNVNDGHCDYDLCCDGSEEWGGMVKCEDRCKEIGKEYRKKNEARQKGLDNAAKKRLDLVADALRLRLEVMDRVKSLATEIEAGEVKVTQLEVELAEVERREKGRIVRGGDASGGKLGVLKSLARQRIDELKGMLEKVREQRDTHKSRLEELEAIMTTFKEEYNPNFNDEGVKRAVRAWEDYAARDKWGDVVVEDRDLEIMVGDDKENGLDWEEFKEEEVKDTDVLYEFENYLPPTLRSWLDGKLRDVRVALIDAGILAASTSASGANKAIESAKDQLRVAQQDLDGHRRSRDDHKHDLTKDYGPDDVFRALKDQCVEVESGEYTYEVCYMGATNQKPRKGGGHTNMGHFSGFEIADVDDVLPADGRGLGKGERLAMKFDNGQHCWNGPSRSTLVIMTCAEVNEIWKVVEAEKCVYRMEMGTPAVCTTTDNLVNGGPPKHNEL